MTPAVGEAVEAAVVKKRGNAEITSAVSELKEAVKEAVHTGKTSSLQEWVQFHPLIVKAGEGFIVAASADLLVLLLLALPSFGLSLLVLANLRPKSTLRRAIMASILFLTYISFHS